MIKGLYGFCDRKGTVVIKPAYSWVLGFSQGRAAVYKDGKAGISIQPEKL
jgi:hypothetical protein